MADSIAAPQTHKQSSRKGKRAWRKNVDITEIQSGLENARNEIIATGGLVLADVPSDILFQTDTTGSELIKKQARKAHPQLRADEIIAQRSAVPAVGNRKRSGTAVTDGIVPAKRRKGAGVSHKELQRLKDIAHGGDLSHKNVVSTDGTANYDPWAVVEVPKPTYDESFLEGPDIRTEPKTLKHAPIALTASGKPLPNVRKPAAGRSYNPDFEDWKALLDREGMKEVEKEKARRLAAAAEEERQLRIDAATAEAERTEQREALMSEFEESEWEGIQSDMDEASLKKKRPVRKTQVERNKVNKRKTAERLAKHESRMKARDEQVKRLQQIQKELKAKDAERATTVAKFPGSVESEDSEEDGEVLRRRRLGKHFISEAPLEVVLADELQDSLRRLKPEGNLLSDRYRNMMVQGKIEARKTMQHKKANRKATEKWSSKDFRLENYK